MTLGEFFRQHYAPIRLLGRAAATVADMRSFCARWDAIMGPVELADIDLHTAANYLRETLKDHSPATVNKHRAYLLAMLREARCCKLCRPKWFRRLPRVVEYQKLPVAWDREQSESILRIAALWPGEMAGIALCRLLPALLLFVLNTGTRIGAALTIRTVDVDLHRRSVIVRAPRQKQRAEQWLPLNDRTAAAIRLIFNPSHERLFSWVASMATLRRILSRICEIAQVPAGGHSGLWHRGRTTAISHAWAQSPEAARQMAGHPSIETTRKHYVDPRVTHAAATTYRGTF